MPTRRSCLTALLWFASAGSVFGQSTYFVDRDATGPLLDGSDWCHAFIEIPEALDVAVAGDVIRVADGVYLPDTAGLADPREATFQLVSGVLLEGGFAGCGATNPDERDIVAYKTVLSGDLGGNDGPDFANNSENSYHVVTATGTSATTVVDGLVITGGNAEIVGAHGNGGGFSCDDAAVTIENCVIEANHARWGAGLYGCSGTIRDSDITANHADVAGGGIANFSGTIDRCTISANKSGNAGGGVYSVSGVLLNTVVAGNRATITGGGFSQCDADVLNCTIVGNKVSFGTGGALADCSGTWVNCVFMQNGDPFWAYSYPYPTYSCMRALVPDTGNIESDPPFVTLGRWEGSNWIDGDYHLLPGSLCIDAGDNTNANLAAATLDRAGFLRFYDDPNTTDVGNGVAPIVDMGALEFGDCNGNLVPDPDDIGSGTSDDCNANLIPDECILSESDCNENNVPDACDIADNTSDDCTTNAIPDECEPDCDSTGVADICEIADGLTEDCNQNVVPDSCDINSGYSSDLVPPGGDGTPDECQVDCNVNGVLDTVDIQDGTSSDCDENGIPDECQWQLEPGVPSPLNNNASTDSGHDWNMYWDTDGNGVWLAVWSSVYDLTGDIENDTDVFFSRSVDDGLSWSPAAVLNSDAAEVYKRKYLTTPVTDGNGNWLVAWYESNYGPTYISWSTDAGVSWSPTETLPNAPSGTQPAIATDGGGTWIVVYTARDIPNQQSGIWYSMSGDNGTSWQPGQQLSSSDLGYNTRIATDGAGDWVAVWISAEDLNGQLGADRDILYSRSSDNGVSWSAPAALNGNASVDVANDDNVRIQVDSSGTWVVNWSSDDDLSGTIGVDVDILMSTSINGGASWTYPVPLSESFYTDDTGDWIATIHEAGNSTWLAAWYSRYDPDGAFGEDVDHFMARLSFKNDCNDNGVLDACDIQQATSEDCNSNGIPDECDPAEDCNGNGVQDICDIAGGTSQDCSGNEIPDECEPDCNGNGIADTCDIVGGTSVDCNGNDVPDDCDIAAGTSIDVEPGGSDGIPDDCQGIFHVPSVLFPTIQSAIDAAGDGSTILVSDGTYSGVGNRNLDFAGKRITLRCPNGPEACIIDCQGIARGFHFHSGETSEAVVDGFKILYGFAFEQGGGMLINDSSPTITNCKFKFNTSGSDSGGSGAGIYASGSGHPTVTNCTFTGNIAEGGSGGGIAVTPGCGLTLSESSFASNNASGGAGLNCWDCDLIMADCTFTGNIADGYSGRGGGALVSGSGSITGCTFNQNTADSTSEGEGGGLYLSGEGSMMLSDCVFNDNIASGTFGGDGGGMYLSGSPSVTSSIFSGNTAGHAGGGMYIIDGSPEVTDCGFVENHVIAARDFAYGGGMYNHNSSPTVTSCAFTGNTSTGVVANGGGMFSSRDSHPVITSCLFSSNITDANGGAIYNRINSSATVINSTFSENSAASGGGIYNRHDASSSIINSIFWNHGGGIFTGIGTVSASYSNIQGGYPGLGNIDADPLFIDPANDNYHLAAGSPSIDAGIPNYSPSPGETDLDGDERVQHCRVDMGSDETPFFADCNTNGLGDACDVVTGSADDCDGNLVPDVCQDTSADCNSNSIWDLCDIAAGISNDCNSNQIPDQCELTDQDCNQNDTPDDCDIAVGTSVDCNNNYLPDECDIASGVAPDADGNGIPDPCETIHNLYWGSRFDGNISRNDTDGTNGETLVTGIDLPSGIALDPASCKMYWSDTGNWTSSDGSIVRANLDGSDVEVLIDIGLPSPHGLAVDSAAGKVYWSDFEAGVISRANVDGSSSEILVTSSVAMGLSLDLDAGQMYWCNASIGTIYRADLDGSGVQLIVSEAADIRHLALDLIHGKIYWTDTRNDRVQRANLDGSAVETVAILLSNPGGIVVDPEAGKIYWGDSFDSVIYRANLDGTGKSVAFGGAAWVAGLALDLSVDCNGNGVADGCDIMREASVDIDENGVPDECQPDCNDNGVPDSYEPDNDCDINGVQDICDVAAGALDCNFNQVPDECEPDEDCNTNGVRDICEIGAGTVGDCNGNSVPDACDLLGGSSPDSNGNGVPDECDPPSPLTATSPYDIRKNRFISINPNSASATVSLRVELLDLSCSTTGRKCDTQVDCKTCVGGGDNGVGCSLDSDCLGATCEVSGESCEESSPPVSLGWVGEPSQAGGDALPGTFTADVVKTQPVARSWPESVVHVGGCEIAPVRTYAISTTADGGLFSDRLIVGTIKKPQGKFWADVVGNFDGTAWNAPNELVNVDDVSAVLKFLSLKPAPHVTVLDLVGSPPTYLNFDVNATDLQMVLEGFVGETWPPAAVIGLGYPPSGDVTLCP